MNALDTSSVDLSNIVDGLDLEDELFGSTEGDDGIDTLAGTTKGAVIDDEDTAAPTTNVPAATDTAVEGTFIPANGGGSKADKARVIFARMYGKAQRKDVIAAFVAEAGLTAKGAGTYYQNFTAKLKKAEALTKPAVAADVTVDDEGATLEA